MQSSTKRYSSFLLALLIWCNAISTAFVMLDYEIRKDYIVKFLCINKDKPQFRCAGSCHLKKELRKAENKQTHHGSKFQNLQWEYIAHDLLKIYTEYFHIDGLEVSSTFGHKHLISLLVMLDFFHPPQV